MEFKSTHNLDFEVAPYEFNFDPNYHWSRFRIGTCEGLWCCKDKTYRIMAVINNKPNNGHFKDVLDWFYNSCKRDKKVFVIMEFMNDRFKNHLIEKHGFKKHNKNDLIKKIN